MQQKKRIAIIDIESNNFTENLLDYSSFPYKFKPEARLWCVVVRDYETGEDWYAELNKVTPEWLKNTLEPFYYIAAHNGQKFDLPQLKLFNVLEYTIGYVGEIDTVFGRECKFLDSLILSRLANPDRTAHSLAYWGKKTGEFKDDYRQQCIEAGYIKPSDPKGAEFREYNPLMLPYCRQDCKTNATALRLIMNEFRDHNWKDSIQMEHKLADLAFRREHLGFDFDKNWAIECLEDLNSKMESLSNKVLPLIPPKPLNQTETGFWTPPKTQIIKSGALSKHMISFLDKIGAKCKDDGFVFDGFFYKIPYEGGALKTHQNPEMKDLDHIKMHLIDLGWVPTEWSERDITKDSKKKILPFKKRVAVLDRWFKETTEKGKYREARFKELGIKEDLAYYKLYDKLGDKWPVRVPTGPKIKIGLEKELCPNLIKLGEKVEFAKDFAMWLTYRHRRNSIAGGDTSDMDFDEGDTPETGFLSMYREADGRVPTPAIEIGCNTSRYVHIGIANIPRASSIYGKEMRSLFGAGKGFVQLGFDFSSLENRVQGHYIYKYEGGPEMAKTLIAEKPNDSHSLNAKMLGMERGTVKSFTYAVLYGSAPPKISKMLGTPVNKSKDLIDGFWDGNPPLKQLKQNLEKYWEGTGKKYILGIDGRKVPTRSKHSLLNALLQSGGVISAKYTIVKIFEILESQGHKTDPFECEPDFAEMIAYHDENQLVMKPEFCNFKIFNTKEDAEKFVTNWEGEQLSSISESSNGGYFITLPNPLSSAILQAIKHTQELLKINVDLGIEWVVNKNWYGCH